MSMKVITPLEALGLYLRARYPARPALVDEITSVDWFLERQLDRPIEGTIAALETTVVFEALNSLIRDVTYSIIRLRGILRSDGAVTDVDPADQAVGDLNIWEMTFDCSVPELPNRIFRNVRCVEADAKRAAKSQSPTARLPPFNEKTAATFVKTYLETAKNPTVDGLRESAKGRGNRNLVELEYSRQFPQKTGRPVKRDPRPRIPQK
jgi:hypothetical protein